MGKLLQQFKMRVTVYFKKHRPLQPQHLHQSLRMQKTLLCIKCNLIEFLSKNLGLMN